MQDNYDVVICGLGPTGAILANLLALKDISVMVIERDEDIYYAPRAVHFDDETMRIFQAAGLAEIIESTSEPFKKIEFVLKPGENPRLTANIGWQDYRYGYNGAYWFHQPTLEKNIRDGLDRFQHVKVLYGAEVNHIFQTHDHVEVTAMKGDDTSITITGKYLIGCDGGKSFVRKSVGITLESADFNESWVVMDTKTRSGQKDDSLPKNHRQYCDPKQPVTYVPLAGPYYEWQFMVVDGKNEQQATEPFYIREKLKPFVDLEKIEIIRAAYYRFHALWAKQWYNSRVILAGDSAHQMPPFLGQGMCSGVRDASALAWRLSLILKGKTDSAILESYQTERLIHVSHIIKGAMFLGGVIQTTNPVKAFLRNNLLFSPISKINPIKEKVVEFINRKKPLEKGIIGTNRKNITGHLIIQPRVDTLSEKNVLLHEVLKYDFAILSRKGTLPLQSSCLKQLSFLGLNCIEFDTQCSEKVVMDLNGTLKKWFNQHNIDFVVIRPDQYIYDGGKSADAEIVLSNLLQNFKITSPIPTSQLV